MTKAMLGQMATSKCPSKRSSLSPLVSFSLENVNETVSICDISSGLVTARIRFKDLRLIKNCFKLFVDSLLEGRNRSETLVPHRWPSPAG